MPGAAQEFEYRHQLAKLGRPVDRGEWWLGAHTVNAVFLPLQNAMNFPAGILEPPFYDRNADPAYNYGAIGSVIGHEISHSFDNLGAEFDAEGRLRNWWTRADSAHFREASQALVRQYNAYEPFPGLHLNGELTLGENIADLAGLAAAYDAYQRLAGRPGGAGDRRPDRRPALLPRLCPEPPRAHPRGDAAQPDRDRRPLAGPLPRRDGPQPRRLVHARSTSGPASGSIWRRRRGSRIW